MIGYESAERLAAGDGGHVEATWWAFVVLGVVIAVDASRMLASRRSARRFGSAALAANALHFASDLAGSLAVLVGMVLVAAGKPAADAIAALLVAALVVALALRLAWQSIEVLMDRTSADAELRIRAAFAELREPVELRRVRVRYAAGRHFVDLVVGVAPDKGVGQAHATADTIEDLVSARARQRRRAGARRAGRPGGRAARARDRGGGDGAGGARGPQRARHATSATATSCRSTSSSRASSASRRRTT